MEVSRSRLMVAASAPGSSTAVSAAAVREALATPEPLAHDGARCPACCSTVRGRFCTMCGEQAPHRQPRTIWAVLKRGAGRLLDADSRLLRSLRLLLFRPGALTRRFLAGHRAHYVNPLKLFALVNVAFVLFVGAFGGPATFRNPLYYHIIGSYPHQTVAERWVAHRIDAPEGWRLEAALHREDSLRTASSEAAASETTRLADGTASAASAQPTIEALSRYRDYAQRFDRQAGRLAETLAFLFIPVLAGVFWGGACIAGTLRSGQRALASLVQATHFMTAVLILHVLTLLPVFLIGLFAKGMAPVLSQDELVFLAVFSIIVGGSLTVSIRRVEQASWRRALLQAALVVVSLYLMQRMYTALLFFIAFFLTG